MTYRITERTACSLVSVLSYLDYPLLKTCHFCYLKLKNPSWFFPCSENKNFLALLFFSIFPNSNNQVWIYTTLCSFASLPFIMFIDNTYKHKSSGCEEESARMKAWECPRRSMENGIERFFWWKIWNLCIVFFFSLNVFSWVLKSFFAGVNVSC